jgi:amidase
MNSVDLAFLPALAQAQLIQKREISPVELTQLYLDRIQQLDSQLGSYYTVAAEQAIADAKAKTEILTQHQASELPPFFGVPIAIKDLTLVEGLRCTFGSQVLKDNIAPCDDGVVTRIRQAGFVILGKTAASEVGSLPYTEPDGFPPTRNPWNLDYTSGGSSGGSAAAVAAGLSPIALGSDGGGSIRGPASCCGLVGIKPSRGRVSSAPGGDRQSGIATNGSLARTVTDAAALLDVISGYVVGDPYWLPDPDRPFVEVAQQGAQQGTAQPLRIAFSTGMPPIGSADPICQQAVLDVAKLLEGFGHQLEPACPNCEGLIEPFTLIWRSGVSASGLPPEALGSFNRWLMQQADTSGDYLRATWAMQMIARRIVAFFEEYDALILPVFLHPTIRVGEWATLSPEELMPRLIHWVAPCPPFNASGQPSIAIPTGFDSNGVPIGVQIVGRPADEATIIAIAAHIEAAQPWNEGYPAFAVGA